MPITLPKPTRDQAIASIERYFEAERGERIGNIAAGALLGFFLQEVAPAVYNQAVAEAQERLQQRVLELDIELHEDEFRYWHQQPGQAGKARGR